jgi:uncharacterized membrane protein required for colicin V production
MLSLLIALIVIAGCVAYLYFKGTLVRGFALVITTICSAVAAFGYFEPAANLLIGRNTAILWAQTISFSVIFVVAFAVLLVITFKLTGQPIDFGLLPERIGRVVCGIIAGFTISGIILTALAMAPLSNKTPYQRFDAANPNAENPHKSLLNADGFAAGLFGMLSKGTFSGARSFAVLHANFLDQLFLNRLRFADKISLVTAPDALESTDKAVWPAPEGLKDPNGNPLPPKSGYNLMIARIGITGSTLSYGDTFTLSQLRLICNRKNQTENIFGGKGKSIYPVGFIKIGNILKIKPLDEPIKLEQDSFEGRVKWIDFIFYVPNDFVPVAAEFKQNGIAQMSLPITADQATPAEPFLQSSEYTKVAGELKPVSSAKIYGVELATGQKFLGGLSLKIDDPNQWQIMQTERSIGPPKFESGRFDSVRAELKIEKPAEEPNAAVKAEETASAKPSQQQQTPQRSTARFRPGAVAEEKLKGVAGMLKPLEGYTLLSLRCNNPAVGTEIKAEELPVLVELSGAINHAVGVIASGKVGEENLCEFDYCSTIPKDSNTPGCLTLAENGSVAKPFPESVWLTQQAQEISEFYVLYMVKSGANIFITSVRPAGTENAAAFKQYEGLLIK